MKIINIRENGLLTWKCPNSKGYIIKNYFLKNTNFAINQILLMDILICYILI